MDLNAIPKVCLDFITSLLRIQKQRCSVSRNDSISQKDRVEVDVGAAEVEQPRDFIQHVYDECTVPVFEEFFAHGGKLVSVGLAGV